MRNDGGLEQGSGSGVGELVIVSRHAWEIAPTDGLELGCADRRKGKGKIKNESQVSGLSKREGGDTIKRDSGEES